MHAHQNTSFGINEKRHGSKKWKWKLGKKWPSMSNSFQKRSMASCGKKRLPRSLNSWIPPPIGFSTQKTWNSQPWECGNNIKSPMRDPFHCTLTKPLPNHWKDEEHCKNVNGECPRSSKNVRKRKTWMHGRMGIRFWVFFYQEVKTRFSKMGALPNSNFSHTIPIPMQ